MGTAPGDAPLQWALAVEAFHVVLHKYSIGLFWSEKGLEFSARSKIGNGKSQILV